MFLEKKWENWASHIRKNKQLPLRVEFWNGRQIDLSDAPPQVAVRIPHISALPYLFSPSILSLANAYVEEKVTLEGELHTIIAIGNALTENETKPVGKFSQIFPYLLGKILRTTNHSREKSKKAIEYHYDVSNEFYQLWLDQNMVYSCAYFEQGEEDLATAQIKKIDHILKKIQLRPGQTLLDIGCGWGALVLRAAQQYGAKCVGITLSKNQEALARKRVFEAGLNDRIEIRLQDYRDVQGSFDRITSVGMFEHVGLKNLPSYFAKINSLLADNGIAMNHGITTTDVKNRETPYGEFIENYVFPKGQLPHISTVLKTMQDGGLEALDVENLRRHYAKTCGIWADNFEAHTEQIKQLVGEKKYRIWRIYLAGCAYAFQRDWISLYQIVCVKSGQNPSDFPWSRNYMYQPKDY